MAAKNDCLQNFRSSRELRDKIRLAAKEQGLKSSAYLRYMSDTFSTLELFGEVFTYEDLIAVARVAKMRGGKLGILEVLDLLSKKKIQ